MLDNAEDIFLWAWYKQINTKEGQRLQLTIIAVLVTIWKARNGVIFEKKRMETDREFQNAQEIAYLWISSRNSKFKMALNTWILNPKSDM